MSWIVDTSANKFVQTYFKGFVDISGGGLFLRNGNINLSTTSNFRKNNYTLSVPTLTADDSIALSSQLSSATSSISSLVHFPDSASNFSFGSDNLTLLDVGESNIAFGVSALSQVTSAINNTAFGFAALRDTTSGGGNGAFGNNALAKNTTGTGNNASGSSALGSNTTGSYNIATGSSSLFTNVSGSNNTAYGYRTLRLSTGSNNTAVGGGSSSTETVLGRNTTGSNNTAVGYVTLTKITTGSNNTAVGQSSGSVALVTGSNNTLLGSGANTTVDCSNSTALGAGASVTGSNQIVLGTVNESVYIPNKILKSTAQTTATSSEFITSGYLSTLGYITTTTADASYYKKSEPITDSTLLNNGVFNTPTLISPVLVPLELVSRAVPSSINSSSYTYSSGTLFYENGTYEVNTTLGNAIYPPYKALDNNLSTEYRTQSIYKNNFNTDTSITLDGVNYGDYFTIKLPYKLYLSGYSVASSSTTVNCIRDWTLFGSVNDGANWNIIDQRTGQSPVTSTSYTVSYSKYSCYNMFAFQVNYTKNTTSTLSYASVKELNLFGGTNSIYGISLPKSITSSCDVVTTDSQQSMYNKDTISAVTLTASGTVSGTSITSSGIVSGTSIESSGTVSGTSITSSGTVSGSTISATTSVSTPSISTDSILTNTGNPITIDYAPTIVNASQSSTISDETLTTAGFFRNNSLLFSNAQFFTNGIQVGTQIGGLLCNIGSVGSTNTNIRFGRAVLENVGTAADANIGIGNYAFGSVLVTGKYNIGVGGSCFNSLTSGNNNVCIGHNSGKNITTGVSNTCLGDNTGFASTTTQYSSSTAVGKNAVISASNQIALGTATETVSVLGTLTTASATIANSQTLVSTNAAAITANTTLTFPLFSYYTLAPTAAITVTLPTITASNLGTLVVFRRVGGTPTVAVSFDTPTQNVFNTAITGGTTAQALMASGDYNTKLVALRTSGTTYAWYEIP
jgi:hypothetical protein